MTKGPSLHYPSANHMDRRGGLGSGISDHKLFSLIGSFYDAAQQSTTEAWREVFVQMADTLSSGVGGFTLYDTKDKFLYAAISTVPPPVIAEFQSYYRPICPMQKDIGKLKAGQRYNRADHISDEKFMATEIYRAFYSEIGVFQVECQVFLVRPGMLGRIGLTRPEGEENFGAEELRALAVMLPHLERAFQVFVSLTECGLENKIMSEAFDRVPRNVLVVDADLSIIFASSGANALLAGSDGLEIKNNRLSALSDADVSALKNILNIILAGDAREPGEVLLVSRPSGRRPLEVLISPFTTDHFESLNKRPLAMIFICDPDEDAKAIDAVLSRMYGLTSAEARLAALLADGKDLNEVGELLAITQNTVRTHLKRIFIKTDTRRQSELLRLLLIGSSRIQCHEDR